jgi:hypothetical protein
MGKNVSGLEWPGIEREERTMKYEVERREDMPLSGTAGEMIEAGKTLQQIKTPYVTAVAVQKPRELKDVVRRCVEEAELAGDSFYYRWEVESTDKKTGKKKKGYIEGPSINLALAAVRNFGNMAVHQMPVQETRTSWIFTAAVIDLETGFTLERQFRMDKNFTIYGQMDSFRKDDIRFQIGQSKAIRNAVMNSVPAGLVDKMLAAAKNSVRTKIEERIKQVGGDIQKVIAEMLVAFGKHGVTQEMIAGKIGLARDKWDVETLTMLSGDLKALVSGAETAGSLYAEDEQEEPENVGDDEKGLAAADMKPGDASEHQDVRTGKQAAKQAKLGGDF